MNTIFSPKNISGYTQGGLANILTFIPNPELSCQLFTLEAHLTDPSPTVHVLNASSIGNPFGLLVLQRQSTHFVSLCARRNILRCEIFIVH